VVLATCVGVSDDVGVYCIDTGTGIIAGVGMKEVTPIGVEAGTVGVVIGTGVAAGICIVNGVAGCAIATCVGVVTGVGVVACAAVDDVACPLSTPFPSPWLLSLSIFTASSSEELACKELLTVTGTDSPPM
jgi:hypothetical protein